MFINLVSKTILKFRNIFCWRLNSLISPAKKLQFKLVFSIFSDHLKNTLSANFEILENFCNLLQMDSLFGFKLILVSFQRCLQICFHLLFNWFHSKFSKFLYSIINSRAYINSFFRPVENYCCKFLTSIRFENIFYSPIIFYSFLKLLLKLLLNSLQDLIVWLLSKLLRHFYPPFVVFVI